ncbi:MAG: cytidylate kinase family protein [Candidatus Diapherotrites archaeon]
MNKKDRVIIVSGLAGSGKSTLAQNLAEKFGMRCVHASGILRELMEKHVDEITEGAGKNTGWWESKEGRKFLESRTKDGKFDRMLDKKLLEIIEQGNVVLDSWTMPWLSKKGFKIWLDASVKIRAKRVSGRDEKSIDEVEESIRERDIKTSKIYKKLYGFDLGRDMTPFDFVLKTTNLKQKAVFEKSVEALKKADSDSFN